MSHQHRQLSRKYPLAFLATFNHEGVSREMRMHVSGHEVNRVAALYYCGQVGWVPELANGHRRIRNSNLSDDVSEGRQYGLALSCVEWTAACAWDWTSFFLVIGEFVYLKIYHLQLGQRSILVARIFSNIFIERWFVTERLQRNFNSKGTHADCRLAVNICFDIFVREKPTRSIPYPFMIYASVKRRNREIWSYELRIRRLLNESTALIIPDRGAQRIVNEISCEKS